MSKTWKQRWKNPEVLYDLYICKDEKVYELVLVYVWYTMQKKHVTLLLQILMFWYTQKNIGYTFSCNIARLEKETIFFLVRLLVWKWTYVILTHSKMTTFFLPLTEKKKTFWRFQGHFFFYFNSLITTFEHMERLKSLVPSQLPRVW